MSEIIITKDAASLLKSMYRAYKKRIRNGTPKQEAAIFGDPSDIQQEINGNWSLADIGDACEELCGADLLHCLPGDDGIQMAILSQAGIAYAEGQATGALKSIWDILKALLSFIP